MVATNKPKPKKFDWKTRTPVQKDPSGDRENRYNGWQYEPGMYGALAGGSGARTHPSDNDFMEL